MDVLVTTEWLANELSANDLRIVDASYFLSEHGRDAAAEYEAEHIPGAVFMDLAEIADLSNPLPAMLPAPEKFASRMQSLGLGDGSRIVLYDNSPLHTSARAWWMLRTFGAHDVAILDGGMAKWKAEGRATATGKESLRHRHFTVWAEDKGVRTLDQMCFSSQYYMMMTVQARPRRPSHFHFGPRRDRDRRSSRDAVRSGPNSDRRPSLMDTSRINDERVPEHRRNARNRRRSTAS